jgi:hypothetical protein
MFFGAGTTNQYNVSYNRGDIVELMRKTRVVERVMCYLYREPPFTAPVVEGILARNIHKIEGIVQKY